MNVSIVISPLYKTKIEPIYTQKLSIRQTQQKIRQKQVSHPQYYITRWRLYSECSTSTLFLCSPDCKRLLSRLITSISPCPLSSQRSDGRCEILDCEVYNCVQPIYCIQWLLDLISNLEFLGYCSSIPLISSLSNRSSLGVELENLLWPASSSKFA